MHSNLLQAVEYRKNKLEKKLFKFNAGRKAILTIYIYIYDIKKSTPHNVFIMA